MTGGGVHGLPALHPGFPVGEGLAGFVATMAEFFQAPLEGRSLLLQVLDAAAHRLMQLAKLAELRRVGAVNEGPASAGDHSRAR